MECSEALSLLSGHIDGENTEQEEAALQAHLAECADCRALLKAYEDIDSNVAELNVPAPENLVSSVMEKISTPAKAKTRSPWRNLGMSAGLVAAVLVLLIGTKTIKLPNMSDNRAKAPAQEAVTVAPGADEAVTLAYEPSAEEPPQEQQSVGSKPVLPVEGFKADDSDVAESVEHKTDLQAAPSDHLKRRLGLTFAPNVLQHCMALSEDNHAAVLLCDGIDAGFFDWLKEQEPELAEQFETNSEMTVDEETGRITIKADYSTILSLHEWLLSRMCAERDPEQTDELTVEALEELGLDADMANRVFTFRADETKVVWPESWAEDFSLRWLTGESWRLFYPEEEYLPQDKDPAYLILIPPVEPDEAIR